MIPSKKIEFRMTCVLGHKTIQNVEYVTGGQNRTIRVSKFR
jgi:hypothetical protein